METAFSAFDIVKAMVEEGHPNSVTDAGVGALAIRSAVLGAFLNVKINASGLKDKETAARLVEKARRIADNAMAEETAVWKRVNEMIDK